MLDITKVGNMVIDQIWRYCYLLCKRFMFHLWYFHLFYLFTYPGVQHNFNIAWCLCRLAITRRVPLVEQKLTTSRSTWVHPKFSVEFELLNILFSVYSCVDHFCSFIHLHLTIVFSVFRLTASVYLFGIFKLSCDISIPIVLDFIRLSKRYIQGGVTFSYVYPKWLVPQWVR